MNFVEYWNKGKLYKTNPYIAECKKCEGESSEIAWNDCRDEILSLIEEFDKKYKEENYGKNEYQVSHTLYLLKEKIKKEI